MTSDAGAIRKSKTFLENAIATAARAERDAVAKRQRSGIQEHEAAVARSGHPWDRFAPHIPSGNRIAVTRIPLFRY